MTTATAGNRAFPVFMLLLAVLVLAASSILSWRTTTQLSAAVATVGETQRVIERIHRYWGVLGDRDSAILRYLLNGEDQYLDAFRDTLLLIEQDHARLAQDVGDDPVQRVALDRLAALHAERIERADALVALRQRDPAAFQAEIAAVPMSGNADAMRAVLDAMVAHEKRSLAQQRVARERRIGQNRAIVMGANGVAVLAGLLALLAVRRLRRRERDAERADFEARQARQVAAERQSSLEIVAHDLRGHFGNLWFAADLLPDADEPGTRAQLARSIRGSAASGLLFLRAVLEQAAGQARGEAVTELDPAEAIQRLLKESAAAARARSLRFALQLDPALRLRGQALALDHVLRNLLSNAVKFAPEGSEVDVTSEVLADRGRIRVLDRGPGVPEARRSELFQRYVPLSPGGEAPSSGLGLALARQHARAQGGELRYAPREGGGACFQLEWPLA